LDEELFDLVITDLSFKPDHRKVVISDGEELIKTIRQDNIPCKIMVFSIFDRPARVQKLFELYEIDAFVLKGRNDSKELLKAIENIRLGGTFISEELLEILHFQKNLTQVEDIDVQIVQHLCKGLTQEEISKLFQANDIRPNSMSTIEKRLKNLREDFSAKTNIELVLIFKEMGLV